MKNPLEKSQKNTKLSFFCAIISIFLMTEFSTLESIYSNSSEIFSNSFWDSFSLWCFPEHNSYLLLKLRDIQCLRCLSISKNLTLEVISGSSIIYNLVAKQQDSFRAIITIDKERMWKVHCKILQDRITLLIDSKQIPNAIIVFANILGDINKKNTMAYFYWS